MYVCMYVYILSEIKFYYYYYYIYILFSYHIICLGVTFFYNGKDRSARDCLPEISLAQLGPYGVCPYEVEP